MKLITLQTEDIIRDLLSKGYLETNKCSLLRETTETKSCID